MGVIVQNFSISYPGRAQPALRSLSFQLSRGCCAVLGPTSAGKSTLLQVLSGAAGAHASRVTAEGTITIGNQSYTPLPRRILFPMVSLLVQDPAIQMSGFCETVREELYFSLANGGISTERHQESIAWVARRLGIGHLLERTVTTLSGGELQRVAIATALIVRPQVLLLDEPASSLDPQAQLALCDLLRDIASETIVIFSDTSLELALRAANVFLVLDQGSQRLFGDREAFLHHLNEYSALLPCDDWAPIVASLHIATPNSSTRRLRRLLYG